MGLFSLFTRRGKSKNSKPSSRDGKGTTDESLPPSTPPPPEISTSTMSSGDDRDDDDDDLTAFSQPYPTGVIDYDSNARGFSAYGDRSIYGGSVSSEGLTIGNQSYATSAFFSQGNRSVAFSDDSSFFQQSSCQSLNMEVAYIMAPAGKLGIALDTPEDTGAPVVHYVKETSPVYGKMKVGDRLIAVDDEDVSYLTAVKISKILNRKSGNATRKLTVLRPL